MATTDGASEALWPPCRQSTADHALSECGGQGDASPPVPLELSLRIIEGISKLIYIVHYIMLRSAAQLGKLRLFKERRSELNIVSSCMPFDLTILLALSDPLEYVRLYCTGMHCTYSYDTAAWPHGVLEQLSIDSRFNTIFLYINTYTAASSVIYRYTAL